MGTHDIEFYSFHRAQRSVRRADVVLMLIDGTEPISEPDRKLGQYIAEQFKPVILVVNKWDLAMKKVRETRPNQADLRDEDIMEEYGEYLAKELPWIDYAPIAFTTAKESKNIQRVLDLSQHIFKQANERVTTGKLNTAVKQILTERTCPTPSGNRLKVFYTTQPDVAPPTVVLFVNQPAYVTDDYQRFVLNRLRELLPYGEVPIKLVFRPRTQRTEEIAPDATTVPSKTPPRRPTSKPRHRPTTYKHKGAGFSRKQGGRHHH